MRALKYGFVLIVPLLLFVGLSLKGLWVFAVPFFAFALVPLLELAIAPNPHNIEAAEAEMRRKDKLYDLMLYLVVPVLYGAQIVFLNSISAGGLQSFEVIGLILSMGIVNGAVGINVAHELGHRSLAGEQRLAQMLLLPSLYMHFFIEHNRGHHKFVGTPEDSSSARPNEPLYAFWLRSVTGTWMSAWKLEAERVRRRKLQLYNPFHNQMLGFQLVQLATIVLIFFIFGTAAVFCFLASAVVGFLQLETVNYIEHYGLQRARVSDFRYEPVQPHHSWNSDHVLGRLLLFELSRHSDHHFQAHKKYQTLLHHDQSPQMPTGYPGMMMLSLLPPLWFQIMNKRIAEESKRLQAA